MVFQPLGILVALHSRNLTKMKKITFFICCILFAANSFAQRNSVFLQGGYALPLGTFSDYWKGGPGAELQLMHSFSREPILRFSVLANTGIYQFGGKEYYAYSNGTYTSFKTSSISYIPVHAGLRFDMGGTKEIPLGFYISQDVGITFVSGTTGGSRYGNCLNGGFLINRLDLAMGYDSWKTSVGTKYHFFTARIGIRLNK